MTNTNYIGTVKDIFERDRLKPYEGYKVVGIKTPDKDGNIEVVGPHHHSIPYGMSADSSCSKGKHTSENFGNCSCGFYGYNDVPLAVNHWRRECGGNANHAIVSVAFSQRVVVCENGFRASHQRITRILMPHCWNCPKPGEYMIRHNAGFFITGCNDCLTKVDTSGKIREASYTFAEFSKAFSPEGYPPIEVSSAADLGKEAQAFLAPQWELNKAKEHIEKMIEANDIMGLQELSIFLQNNISMAVDRNLSEAI